VLLAPVDRVRQNGGMSHRAVFAVGVVVWAGLVASQGRAQQATDPSDQPPEAPGRALTVKLCGDCHDFRSTVNGRRTPTEWTQVIDDMSGIGAVFSDDEYSAVMGYLGAFYGKVDVNHAPAEDIQLVLELTDAQTAQLMTTRTAGRSFTTVEELAALPGFDRAFLDARLSRIVFSAD